MQFSRILIVPISVSRILQTVFPLMVVSQNATHVLSAILTVVISLSETISTISGEGYHRQPAGGELPGRGPQHDEDMHQTLCQHLIINLRLFIFLFTASLEPRMFPFR